MLENESSSEDEKRMRVEQQLQQGFSYTKQILQNVAILYKNTSAMVNIAKKRVKEAKDINNPSAVKNLTLAINKDLEKLLLILGKQSLNIREIYSKSLKIIKEVEGETIYDSQFGIFNKRYLMAQMTKELSQMSKINHKSTLILTKLCSSVKTQTNEKQLSLINRTLAKLFLKTSRRSDVVAHVGKGIFAMLLRHTDTNSAKFASKRLIEMTNQSHFFLGEKELNLDVRIGIATLDIQKNAEQILTEAFNALESADKSGEVFVVSP